MKQVMLENVSSTMHSIIPFCALSLLLIGCQHDPQDPVILADCPKPLTYQVDILPIIQASCNMGGCHAGAYDTYSGILPKINSGSFVDRVFSRKGDPVLGMPPATGVYGSEPYVHLSEADREVLACWIRQGFPE